MDYVKKLDDNKQTVVHLEASLGHLSNLYERAASSLSTSSDMDIMRGFLPQRALYQNMWADNAQLQLNTVCEIIRCINPFLHINQSIGADNAFDASVRMNARAKVVAYNDRIAKYRFMAEGHGERMRAIIPDFSEKDSKTVIESAQEHCDPRLQTATDIHSLSAELMLEEIALHLAMCGYLHCELKLHLGAAAHDNEIKPSMGDQVTRIGTDRRFHMETAAIRTVGLKRHLGLK